MTRRLRIASTAFGAMLVPACAGLQPDLPTIKPVNPPIPTAAGYRSTPAAPPTVAAPTAKPRTMEKFADGRPDPPPAPDFARQPLLACDPSMHTDVTAVEHRFPETTPGPVDAPRINLPMFAGGPSPAPEPVPDAEGVIRSPWPVIKGFSSDPLIAPKSESSIIPPPPRDLPPILIPPSTPTDRSSLKPETIPAALVQPPVNPPAAPATLPPGVIGSSIHQSNASPAGAVGIETALPAELTMTDTIPQSGESALLLAVRACQQNKPDEAVEYLKSYDPATQQILLALMPALVRFSEGKLQQMKPEEMDVLLEQLNRVPNMLRSRASLQANNVRLCREVHNFAHVEPFPDRHVFHPGDIVYLYMELANFSPAADPRGGFIVTLVSSLELRDITGALVWRADPKEIPDHVSTPPQDYYRNFRLCVPTVPPGVYTLTVKTTDRPTGREVRKTIEMRIGAR
jgi:hypothetical protein